MEFHHRYGTSVRATNISGIRNFMEIFGQRHDQGTAWRSSSFNDASWVSGNAQFGYGDGDETTTVSYGTNANAKYITTYFRKTISVSNPSAFASIAGSAKREQCIAMVL